MSRVNNIKSTNVLLETCDGCKNVSFEDHCPIVYDGSSLQDRSNGLLRYETCVIKGCDSDSVVLCEACEEKGLLNRTCYFCNLEICDACYVKLGGEYEEIETGNTVCGYCAARDEHWEKVKPRELQARKTEVLFLRTSQREKKSRVLYNPTTGV